MNPKMFQACIKAAVQKGLKYCDPCPLLATPGATWDYYGGEELRQFMKPGLMTLCENKGKNADKKMHPIFLALAAPGQGKSRFLQEFHNLAEEAAVLNATKYGKRFFQFSLTLENGQKYDNAFDSNPQTLLASRMIWQLLNENGPKKQTWATLAGLPPNFTFNDLRSRVYAESICFDDVIRALQEGEELEEGEWSLSLAVDGLHNLPGSENMSNKETPFYNTLQKICECVNRQEGPLVVAAVSATVQVSVEAALADSPQSRIFIQLPLVDVVQRGGQPVFNFSGNRLLELVEQDMGGHGRALEALETAINGYNEHCWNAEVLMSTVQIRLRDAYPGAISSDVIEPVLKAALSGRWLTPNENIGGQNVEKMQLVQLQYNKARTHRRLLMPYIWIHLAVTQCPSLQHWALMDYTAIGKGPDPGGHDFEDFLVNFRALKSLAWTDGEKVGLSDLHAGACLQPSNLKGVQVINRHLEVVTAQGWTATNSNDFGRIKGQNGTVRQRWQKASKQRGAEIELNSSRYSCIVLNAKGAPAADFVSLLQKVEGAPLSECGQAKQGDAPLSKKIIQDERSKSCVGDDLLMLFCSKDKGFGKEDLPPMTGIVQPAQWPQYFGPYVGRAWVAAKYELAFAAFANLETFPTLCECCALLCIALFRASRLAQASSSGNWDVTRVSNTLPPGSFLSPQRLGSGNCRARAVPLSDVELRTCAGCLGDTS